MNPIDDFMRNTKGLTKNPLGIIGLFISLIYGFACLVLSTSIVNLQVANERLPLIWFIIIFPLIILSAFIYLVVNHHEKLYAPSDFRNDDAFTETMTGKRIKEKLEKEAEILRSADDSDENNEPLKQRNYSGDDSKPDPILDEETKIHLDEDEHLEKRISNVEKWAIKDLELEYNTRFKTNQRIVSNRVILELDAYASDSKKVLIAEVKYWQSHKTTKPLMIIIQQFARHVEQFNRAFGNKEVKLVFVLVFDKLNKSVTNQMQSFVSELEQNVVLRIKEYSELKKDYKE